MILAWFALGLVAPAQDLVRVSELRPAPGERITQAFAADLNADGRPDLVLISAPDGGDAAGRRLRLHYGKADGRHDGRADAELDLTSDVIAIAPGDVHADPGAELVLWSPSGAYAWRPRPADDSGAFVRLGAASVLWQRAHAERAVWWAEGVRDLDGDGLADLLTPEREGYRIHRQRRAAGEARFEPVGLFEVPLDALAREERREVRVSDALPPLGADEDGRNADFGFGGGAFELRFGGGGGRGSAAVQRGTETLIEHTVRLPAPLLVDFDGDGALDLLAQGTQELFVWRDLTTGGRSDLRLPLPVAVDRARALDLSHAAAVGQIDADGRADVVVFAGDKRSDEVRTQVLVFRAADVREGEPALFGKAGRPSELLVLAGFAGGAGLLDVNGDGLDDLIANSVRPDLLAALTGGEALELELNVFLSRNGRFGRRPDLSERLLVRTDAVTRGLAWLDDTAGDGVRDLLVLERDKVVLYLVRPNREGGLARLPQALWSSAAGEDARLVPARWGGGNAAFVVEPDRVRFVEGAR